MISSIISEIEMQSSFFSPPPFGGSREGITSIYFGGGTPSLLSTKDISNILEATYEYFNIEEGVEITLEANPDDLTSDKILELKSTCINRLSIGVQSFYDDHLKFLGRIHTANEALTAIEKAQTAGFENLSVDLIYGIPGLTETQWKANIDILTKLNIPHISCYSLTIEPRTALAKFVEKGTITLADEGESISQFYYLIERLREKGYEHYEISNFSKPGKRSLHNTGYWLGEAYLGIGPSAHSFNGTDRWANVSNNVKYIDLIRQGLFSGEVEPRNMNIRFNEYVMVSLRTQWGIDLKKVSLDFGEEYSASILSGIKSYMNSGLLIMDKQVITLTNKGKIFADRISSDLMRI